MLAILLSVLESDEEKQSFTQFYYKHAANFYRYAFSILHSPALAEDAVQEAWMRCVCHAEDFFSLSKKERLPWMVVIVRNASFNLLKKENRYTTLEGEGEDAAEEAASCTGIVEIIRSMPEQYRTILELKFVLEWSDKEIAQYLKLSLGTVSTRIWRGRKLLQEALREEGYAYE